MTKKKRDDGSKQDGSGPGTETMAFSVPLSGATIEFNPGVWNTESDKGHFRWRGEKDRDPRFCFRIALDVKPGKGDKDIVSGAEAPPERK